MTENEVRQPDHIQAWIDLVCEAAQSLGAQGFYEWLQLVGRGTDEERARKGAAFLSLLTGARAAEWIPVGLPPVPERAKDIDRFPDLKPPAKDIDRFERPQDYGAWLKPFRNRPPGGDYRLAVDAADMDWARKTAWAFGYTEGPAR